MRASWIRSLRHLKGGGYDVSIHVCIELLRLISCNVFQVEINNGVWFNDISNIGWKSNEDDQLEQWDALEVMGKGLSQASKYQEMKWAQYHFCDKNKTFSSETQSRINGCGDWAGSLVY